MTRDLAPLRAELHNGVLMAGVYRLHPYYMAHLIEAIRQREEVRLRMTFFAARERFFQVKMMGEKR